MSHLVSVHAQVKDPAAVQAACQRLGLSAPVQGKARLFSGEVEGLAVQLPAWIYPIICDTTTGQVRYDNFNGRWGNPRCLDAFLQMYACEKAKIESRRRGHLVTEQTLADGSIRLTIQIQGSAA